MNRLLLPACTLLLLLVPLAAQAEIFLTKQVEPTPGLEGFFTHTITATSNVGKITAYDFSKLSQASENAGIVGPVHQGAFSSIFGTPDDPSLSGIGSDSRFLFSPDQVLNLLSEESDDFLGSAFTLYGSALGEATPSESFVQIVTNDPGTVYLSGKIVSRWTDRATDAHVDLVNLSLADIPIGPAPDLASLPLFTPPVNEVPLVVPVPPTVPTPPVPPVNVPTEVIPPEETEQTPPIEPPLPNLREELLSPETQRWISEFRTIDVSPIQVYPYEVGEMGIWPPLSLGEISIPQHLLASTVLFDGGASFDLAGQIPITDGLASAIAFQTLIGLNATQGAPPVTSVPEAPALLLGIAGAASLLFVRRIRPRAAA